MVTLYVNSRRANSGKSTIVMGLALKMIKDGCRVGFMKPVGRFPVEVDGVITDQDALFIKDCLKIDESLEQISPVVKTYDFIQDLYADKHPDIHEKILNNFDNIKKGKDIVILEGQKNFYEGSFIGLTGIDIAVMLDTKVLLVDEYESDQLTIDFFLNIKKEIGDRMIGAVINKVSHDQLDYVNNKVVPFLKKKEVDVLAVLPEDKILGSVSIRQLVKILNGQVLCCDDKLDELVENFTVGAMEIDNALKYFRKITNKAVITGGGRSDIHIAALETSIKCLILTGGLVPNQIVISKAIEKGVPVISVRNDTFSIVEIMERELDKLEIREEKKMERISELIEREINFAELYDKLGLIT